MVYSKITIEKLFDTTLGPSWRRTARQVREQHKTLFELAVVLQDQAQATLENIANDVAGSPEKSEGTQVVTVRRSNAETDYWFWQQIIGVAKKLDYYAGTHIYRTWVQLVIRRERQMGLIISFHTLGLEFVNVAVASAFIEYRRKSEEDGSITIDGPYPICAEILQFSDEETREEVIQRFQAWLKGLNIDGHVILFLNPSES